MLDYCRLTKIRFILNEVHIEINDDITFPHAMLTATIRTFGDDHAPLGPIVINFIFTNVGQRTANGGFVTSLKAQRGDTVPYQSGVGNLVIRDHFGNVPALEKYVKLDEPFCYKAGTSLRYSENLPTPSEFINEMDMCISDANDYLDFTPEGKDEDHAEEGI